MMNERIKVDGTIGRAIDDLDSPRAKGFFEGARAMMMALEAMPADERSRALAYKNRKHIIALLLESERRQQARRHQEACLLLDYYSIDKAQARAFIFDVPAIDDITGRAMDRAGNFIEDENFKLLPGKTNPGYPNSVIYNCDTNQEISQSEYNQLSAEEKENYGRYRVLTVTSPSGKPAVEIRSFDRELMTELIRRDIAILDPDVIERYRTMRARACLEHKAPNVPCGFCSYFQVIDEALGEPGWSQNDAESPLSRCHKHIVGAMLESKKAEHGLIPPQGQPAESSV